MAIDAAALRTRRALLVASLGGLAATVAAALGRPEIVRAGSDGDVVLGAANASPSTTSIGSLSSGVTAFQAVASGAGNGIGVHGHSAEGFGVLGASSSGIGVVGGSTSSYGVRGTSVSNNGVQGQSTSGQGVVGTSDTGFGVSGTSPNSTGVVGSSGTGVGVHAYSNATTQPAGRGWSGGNSTGLLGYSGDSLPAARARTGVYGEASQDATSVGVYGRSGGGRGVQGNSTSGRGVHGESVTGDGVKGYASKGTGLFGQTSGPKIGVALHTVGKVKLDNSAGIATIAAGTRTVTVTPGIDLTTTTAVVATLQGDPGGTTSVQRVAIDTATDTFTIWLTANSTGIVKVAWHAFN
jgi:hypothetical protein